ncbi:MAG: OmpH family outer membrane protein [Paracoccaceae bacterium]
MLKLWSLGRIALSCSCIIIAGVQVTPAFSQQLGPLRDTSNGNTQAGRSIVQSPVLTVDSERLFSESKFGQRVALALEEAGQEIQAENDQIAAELELEELELTKQREVLEPEEFRRLAAAFDEKAEKTRGERAEASRTLSRRLEEERRAFLSAAVPILQEIMLESGAAVVLEQRSVFISARAVDITAIAIDRIDSRMENDATELPK